MHVAVWVWLFVIPWDFCVVVFLRAGGPGLAGEATSSEAYRRNRRELIYTHVIFPVFACTRDSVTDSRIPVAHRGSHQEDSWERPRSGCGSFS